MIDWQSIASAHLDGSATEQESASLADWIGASPDNADEYALWLELHDSLKSHYFEAEILHTARVDALQSWPPTRVGVVARRPIASLAACSLAVAATLLIGLWGAGMLKAPEGAGVALRQSEQVDLVPNVGGEIAATLTGAVDCKWHPEYTPIRYGEHLCSGTIVRLSEGLVQLTYESGAKLVLRGPTEYRVSGPTRGMLSVGQLTAVVPRRAAGFLVQTPCAEIVDLGTEFAVDVKETGVSEVHVFKGEVVSRHRLSGRPAGSDRHLYTDEAARYGPEEGSIQALKADETRFIREISPRLTASELPREPQIDGLSLWLAADLLVKTDGQDRVVAWSDVLCGDNQSPDDALQVEEGSRPLFVPGAMNGADTIRFDGASSHLVTTPMESGDNQTVLMVARIASTNKRYHTGSILNYNGPPHRDMESLAVYGEPGVLQIGLGPMKNGRAPLESFVYVGDSARSGAVVSKPILLGEPVVIAYVYDMHKNRAAVYVNGELNAEASAPAPAAVTSRRVIGRHGHHPSFFRGELSEILIYNRAIGPNKLDKVTQYLFEKYSIEPEVL